MLSVISVAPSLKSRLSSMATGGTKTVFLKHFYLKKPPPAEEPHLVSTFMQYAMQKPTDIVNSYIQTRKQLAYTCASRDGSDVLK